MANYELLVDTDVHQKVARFKLSNADTAQHLASNEVILPEHSSALWEGAFDTRRYIERYDGAMIFDGHTEPASAEALLQRLGEFLGERVLGRHHARADASPSASRPDRAPADHR